MTIERLPMPDQLEPNAFRVLDSAIKGFSEIFDGGEMKTPETYLDMVRINIGVRTYNLLKCIRHLLCYGYWEECQILLRTLFELLVKLEDIERGESEEKAKRFVLSAAASRLVRKRNDLVYRRETGRRVETGLIERIDEYLRTRLEEFLDSRTLDKRYLWIKRDKPVRELAMESAKDRPIREHQYYLLYGELSEYVHAAPSAILGDLGALIGNFSTDDYLSREKHEVRTASGLAVTLAIEILWLLKPALPTEGLSWVLGVMKQARRLFAS